MRRAPLQPTSNRQRLDCTENERAYEKSDLVHGSRRRDSRSGSGGGIGGGRGSGGGVGGVGVARHGGGEEDGVQSLKDLERMLERLLSPLRPLLTFYTLDERVQT